MQHSSDPHARQRVFDQWCADMGILFRSTLETLEISRPPEGIEVSYLLLESPESIRFTDEVSVVLQNVDGATTEIPVLILSDGAQRNAFLVTLSSVDGKPAPLAAGNYEIDWSIERV